MSAEQTVPRLETIEAYSAELRSALQPVPEIAPTVEWLGQHPELFIDVIEEYLVLLAKIDAFTSEELAIIATAERIRTEKNIPRNSASHLVTTEFMKALSGSDISLQQAARAAFLGTAPELHQATQNLGTLLLAGHEMFARGGIPKDGDSASDQVIWGHTQMTESVLPETVAHFIVSHFLAQYFLLVLNELNILHEKDDFFAPLTSVLLLHTLTETKQLSIVEVWKTARADGGLDWLKQDHFDMYAEAIEQVAITSN